MGRQYGSSLGEYEHRSARDLAAAEFTFQKRSPLTHSGLSLPTLSTHWRIADVGDFNGDEDADLVWQNTSTGQIAACLLKDGVLPNQ
jgi:hypothetical protein